MWLEQLQGAGALMRPNPRLPASTPTNYLIYLDTILPSTPSEHPNKRYKLLLGPKLHVPWVAVRHSPGAF